MDHPLSRHPFVVTRDPDEARREISKIFAPHDLAVAQTERPAGGAASAFRARHHHARLGSLSFNFIEYHPRVAISSGPTKRYYLLLVPQRGTCRVGYGDRWVEIAPGRATVINPSRPLRLDWGGGCAQLVAKIDRMALERVLEQHLDGRVPAPPIFDFDPPATTESCGSLIELMRFICVDLDRETPALDSTLAESETERLFLTLLLTQLPHSYSKQLARPRSRVAPYYVKRAEEFINLHADAPITLAEIVAVSGVRPRTLFQGFRTYRGSGPMAYLKAVRLDQVRMQISDPDSPFSTVTQAAAAWGFTHLGNFARDYKKRFGERPSDTLRRAPGGKPRSRRSDMLH